MSSSAILIVRSVVFGKVSDAIAMLRQSRLTRPIGVVCIAILVGIAAGVWRTCLVSKVPTAPTVDSIRFKILAEEMHMNDAIAIIELPNGQSAAMDSRGKWHCKDELLEEFLELDFSPVNRGKYQYSPAHGEFGLYAASEAAKNFSARIEINPKYDDLGPAPPDVKY